MNDQHTYGDFNSDDIRRYFEGKMSPEEMHRIEKAALDDPFFADAMEGFEKLPAANIKDDLADLQQRLLERTSTTHKNRITWWRIAAMLILVLGASTAAWYLSKPVADQTMLAKTEELRPIPKTDSPQTIIPPGYLTDTAKRFLPAREMAKVQPRISKDSNTDKATLKATEPEVAMAEVQQDSKDITPATVEKQKAATEKSASPLVSSLPKDAGIAKAGARSKNEAAEDKKDDARAFAPAKSAAPSSVPSAGSESAPTYYFKGQVTDEHNKPVPYASIRINNAQGKGTYTDVQGKFSIVSSDSVLFTDVISVGYTSKKITLSASADPAKIHLETSTSALNEVVVSSRNPKAVKKEKDNDSNEEKSMVAHAEPADGWSLYEIYIKNNLRIPVTPGTSPLKGTVTVSFYVDPDKGRLSDFRIEKSLGILYDKEAIRVLKDGPPWDVYNTDTGIRTTYTIIF